METGRRLQPQPPQPPQRKRMGTLEWLKITSILQGIHCLCFILSVIFLLFDRINGITVFAELIMIIACFSMINPIGIISFVVTLRAYLEDRKDPEEKARIGAKAAWIFLWPVITTVVWMFAGVAFVEITGGV